MKMLEKISEKIEEIRQQPEHVRIKYVWGAVTISMVIIFAIWIFSISTMFQTDKNNSNQETPATPGITEQLKTLKDQAPSIQSITEGISNTANSDAGVVDPRNSTTSQ